MSPCGSVLEMSGYESGSDEGYTPSGDLNQMSGGQLGFLPLQTGTRGAHMVMFDDRYVTVTASVRGTGCSGGEFDLFSWRSALDGRELIDGWIARQPWSNGDVAIFGHSYSGLTGTMIAAIRPRHLRVVSISGLIDDLYRGIVYPGGITNYGFPLLWTGAVRPAYDYGGGIGGGVFPPEEESTPQCVEAQTTKSRATLNDPLLQGLTDTDNDWYRTRSLLTYIDRINVPTHITGAYQDEQTGPRGPSHLFEQLSPTIARRLVLTNGDHGTQTDPNIRRDRVAWIDYWLAGATRAPSFDQPLRDVFGTRRTATSSARVLLGYQSDGSFEGVVDSDRFPLRQTKWKDLYFSAGNELTFERDAVEAGSAMWFNGSRRQSYSYQAGQDNGGEIASPTGPDELEFSHEFTRETVIAGPITATLRVASSGADTELFVQLIDRAPTGEMYYLQRGMLRASHRAITPALSDTTATGRIYRPWRPHTNPTPITPGATYEYLVEIFPVGHVFQAGHELVVKVHAPPADDNDYMYVQKTIPGVNTLHFSAEQPSSLMLPVIPRPAVRQRGPAPASICDYHDIRCVS